MFANLANLTLYSHAENAATQGASIKGFQGRGTAEDPLLIQCVEDLMDLQRPEVGQQGHHFRLTQDLDISGIQHWPEITFQGHLDGNWKAITSKLKMDKNLHIAINSDETNEQTEKIKSFVASLAIFKYVKEESSIKNIFLNETLLAKEIENSNLTQINLSNSVLALSISNSNLSRLQLISSILGRRFDDSKISESHLRNSTLGNYTEDSHITDIHLYNSNLFRGFAENSSIANCLSHYDNLPSPEALLGRISRSSIRSCMLIAPEGGLILPNLLSDYNSEAVNNYSASTTNQAPRQTWGTQFRDRTLCTQRFFENQLGWDFENTWQWDSATQLPALRLAANPAPSAAPAPQAPQEDALAQQMRQNMWL